MAVTGAEAIAAIKIKGAVTMFLGGPTGSGKTHFTRRLIENRREMFEDYPEAVHYCYVEWQPKLFGEMQAGGIYFHQGLPTLEIIRKWSTEAGGKHMLLILDDLQTQISESKEMATVFTIISHHLCISVIYLCQNINHQGRAARDISLNCHYLVLFNSKRDKLQISHLARQIFPGQNQFLMQAYENAVVSRDHGYILIDLHPLSKREYMVRTDIFPGEFPIIYQPE